MQNRKPSFNILFMHKRISIENAMCTTAWF